MRIVFHSDLLLLLFEWFYADFSSFGRFIPIAYLHHFTCTIRIVRCSVIQFVSQHSVSFVLSRFFFLFTVPLPLGPFDENCLRCPLVGWWTSFTSFAPLRSSLNNNYTKKNYNRKQYINTTESRPRIGCLLWWENQINQTHQICPELQWKNKRTTTQIDWTVSVDCTFSII